MAIIRQLQFETITSAPQQQFKASTLSYSDARSHRRLKKCKFPSYLHNVTYVSLSLSLSFSQQLLYIYTKVKRRKPHGYNDAPSAYMCVYTYMRTSLKEKSTNLPTAQRFPSSKIFATAAARASESHKVSFVAPRISNGSTHSDVCTHGRTHSAVAFLAMCALDNQRVHV